MSEPEKRRVTTPLKWVFSKAPAKGQWVRVFRRACVLFAWSLTSADVASGAAARPLDRTPSGEPLPRYVTLKAAPVNARGGPGEDYRALWRYAAKGLPLQVVEETPAWRRVCDPDGGLGWVRASALEGRRTVMRTLRGDLALRARPAADARVTAMLAARATADLLECKAGWCRLSVDHATGWVRAGEVWGGADTPQCQTR